MEIHGWLAMYRREKHQEDIHINKHVSTNHNRDFEKVSGAKRT